MKNLLFCLLAVLSLTVIHAQDAQLLDKNWFLYSLTIDSIDYPLPVSPNPSEANATMTVNFNGGILSIFQFPCTDGYGTPVQYSSPSSFSMEFAGTALLGNCGYTPTMNAYFTIHYGFYGTEESPNNPFSYIISNDGHSLEITNQAGDKAFYGDTQLLSSKSFSKTDFAIAPNPVKDILTFSGVDKVENLSIYIYDVFGKKVSKDESINWNKKSIDVSSLESGIYFLKFNNLETRKFIKI